MRASNCSNPMELVEPETKCDCQKYKNKHTCHKQKPPKDTVLYLDSEYFNRVEQAKENEKGECNCECDNPDCIPDPDPDQDKKVVMDLEVNKYQDLSADDLQDKLLDVNTGFNKNSDKNDGKF